MQFLIKVWNLYRWPNCDNALYLVPRTDCQCVLLCTATNKKLASLLFWTAKKTNYILKCSDFQKKLIDTITTSNNENDMAAQVFWAVFYSSLWPSQVGPTADFGGAAIPPSISSMFGSNYFEKECSYNHETKPFINMNLAYVTSKSYENPWKLQGAPSPPHK